MDISSTTPSEESDSEESDDDESSNESDTVLFLIHFIISRILHLLHHLIKVIP